MIERLFTRSFTVAIIIAMSTALPIWAQQTTESTMPHQEQQDMMQSETAEPETGENQKPTWQPMMGNTDMMAMMHRMMHGENQWQADSNQTLQDCSMMHGGNMMGMMSSGNSMMSSGNSMMSSGNSMMSSGNPMHNMMFGGYQGENDPQKAALLLQMQGDIMKAVGEIYVKYGKLLAESSAEQE